MKWEEIELELIKLRRELHRIPELAFNEANTSTRIIEFAKEYNPSQIITNIGGNGLAIIFSGEEDGKTVLIRCELDALPIAEENTFAHQSKNKNVAHKCGHDGHMAIVSGLIPKLSKNKLSKGKVVLLFQPAEETGEGASKVLSDRKFVEIKPDYVFALHNLPGFNANEIVIKENEFAAASCGLIIKLKGKTSHAAEPENGITPSLAIAELIQSLTGLPNNENLSDFSLVTIIHSVIGERAFGTTPGYAELMATLRAYKNDNIKILKELTKKLVETAAKNHKLNFELEWVEEFPSTVNDETCIRIIEKCADENNFPIIKIDNPFRWSEDFGHFTNSYNGAMFGLGAGKDHPQLHNPDYDFPDEIIITGIKMFYSIIKKILG